MNEVETLLDLWEQHDRLERAILSLSRRFTDEQLDELQDTGGIAGVTTLRVQDGDSAGNDRTVLEVSDGEDVRGEMLQMRLQRLWN